MRIGAGNLTVICISLLSTGFLILGSLGENNDMQQLLDKIFQMFNRSPYLPTDRWERVFRIYSIKRISVSHDGVSILIEFKNIKDIQELDNLVQRKIEQLNILGEFKREGKILEFKPFSLKPLSELSILNEDRTVNNNTLLLIEKMWESEDLERRQEAASFFSRLADQEAASFKGLSDDAKRLRALSRPYKAFVFDVGGTISKAGSSVINRIGGLLKAGQPVAFITGGGLKEVRDTRPLNR